MKHTPMRSPRPQPDKCFPRALSNPNVDLWDTFHSISQRTVQTGTRIKLGTVQSFILKKCCANELMLTLWLCLSCHLYYRYLRLFSKIIMERFGSIRQPDLLHRISIKLNKKKAPLPSFFYEHCYFLFGYSKCLCIDVASRP